MKMICKVSAILLVGLSINSAFAYDMFNSPPPPAKTNKTTTATPSLNSLLGRSVSIQSPEANAQRIREKNKAQAEAFTERQTQNDAEYRQRAKEEQQAYLQNKVSATPSPTTRYEQTNAAEKTPTLQQQREARTHRYYQEQEAQAKEAPPPPQTSNPYSIGNFEKPNTAPSNNEPASGSWGINY